MATFDFTVPIYGFDQWSASASTNNTVSYPVGTTFTLNPGAALTVIDVQDDDGNPAGSPGNEFSDGFIDTPGDGSTPSTANNDQVLTQPVTINGQSFDVGDQVELEFAFSTTSGETFWVIRIDGQNVGISGPVLPQPGTTYEVASSADASETPIEDVPCFTDGAMVETPAGPVQIEDLRAGDLVMTLDHGAQPIQWVGSRPVRALDMMYHPNLRPIEIAAHAFGPGTPDRTLLVSPNHRVMVTSPQVPLYFGAEEVLVAAKNLVNGATIRPASRKQNLCYRHLLLERHEILIVNGLPSESLYPGTDRFAPAQLLELDLAGYAFADETRCARPVLRRFEAAILAA